MIPENNFNDMLNEHLEENIKKICSLLKEHEDCVREYLARFIAALCDVDVSEMLNDEKRIYNSQCRWLYWYAYRQMTNEPYVKMADRLALHGHRFSPQMMNAGVNKMLQMTVEDTIWKKRWILVKRFIKTYEDATIASVGEKQEPQEVKLVVVHPSNVKVDIEFKKE